MLILAKKVKNKETNRGITIVEILFAVAIMASFIGVLSLAFMLYLQVAAAGPKHTAAVFLADEGIEAVRTIRGRGWGDEIESLTEGETYYLHFSEGEWTATTTEQVIDGAFVRKVTFSEVKRDGDDKIAETGSVDEGARRVDVSVNWDGLIGQSEVEMSAYIMDVLD
ncbi:MAG: type IV pilus modification PilV family protein [Patescibacteria group bacterium]